MAKGLDVFGLVDPLNLITLEFQVMTHPGRPNGFTLNDLGVIGCLPSNNIPGVPEFVGCHAATLREEEKDDVFAPEMD